MTNIETATVRAGATIWSSDDPRTIRTVTADPYEAYRLDAGEFLVTSWNGYITIGRLTGRTRRFWGIDCPTIERFEIDTVATADGAIIGVKGTPIAGTYAVRSENVVTV